MRLFSTFSLILLTAFVARASDYPYVAKITVPECVVRSGPDTAFYATSRLGRGDSVEVYYETQDWCAIRPPLGSFSWVGARYVRLGSGNIGTVVADGLASRVGSDPELHEDKLCDTVQVKLALGEKVLVLDRLSTPENAASPAWLKISPPSGEYRWIPREALVEPKRPPIRQVVYEEQPGRQTLAMPNVVSADAIEEALHTLPFPSETAAASAGSPMVSQAKPLTASAVSPARPTTTQAATDPFQIAFEELKAEARVVLTRSTEDWVFETLIHRGNELYALAPTEKDLEKVYHLVEALQRTRDVRKEIGIRRQFRTDPLLAPTPSAVTPAYTANVGAPAPRSTAPIATASYPTPRIPTETPGVVPAAPAPMSDPRPSAASGFDVVGRLGEFDPLPQGHPPYAVVDREQQILCLVTPDAGVDLGPYVGRQVGINGILGRYEKPGKPDARHIQAQTVAVVE